MYLRNLALASISCGLLCVTPTKLPGADRPAADEATLAEQRRVFREIYADVELGEWRKAATYESLLRSYVLWPDLRAAYLRGTIDHPEDAGIPEFLDEYGTIKPARELRYRYALHLARSGRLDEYLAIYQQFYQGLDIARLDCLALQAELQNGRQDRIVSRARTLWLVGRSQDDACDPVFDTLRKAGLISREHFAQRYALALEAKQFSLARYLARELDEDDLSIASAWLKAQNDAEAFLDGAGDLADTPTARRQVSYAINRIAWREPLLANSYWQVLAGQFSFSKTVRHATERYIALWAAREHLPQAREMLAALPAAAIDTETRRWMVRVALLDRDWAAVVRQISRFPAEEQQQDEWRFWKAMGQRESGSAGDSISVLAKLAEERSYYGFLAADVIDAAYAFDHAPTHFDETGIAAIEAMPEIVRARELYLVGLDGRGRSEWDAATRSLTSPQKLNAAILAHRIGWHSRAIATIANAGQYDDLEIRYPLPWLEDFQGSSEVARIPHSWAYGIARSESLFMRDIRSSAGAIGLMQLMPATGQETAREINLRYSGQVTLTDTTSNIRLGTAYLGKMFNRFDDNRVLATAAYNAGPHRVEKWLREKDQLDARIWIENIPYRETRNYVRRVLTDEAIFHWRLTGQHKRVSSDLRLVGESSDKLQAALPNRRP